MTDSWCAKTILTSLNSLSIIHFFVGKWMEMENCNPKCSILERQASYYNTFESEHAYHSAFWQTSTAIKRNACPPKHNSRVDLGMVWIAVLPELSFRSQRIPHSHLHLHVEGGTRGARVPNFFLSVSYYIYILFHIIIIY